MKCLINTTIHKGVIFDDALITWVKEVDKETGLEELKTSHIVVSTAGYPKEYYTLLEASKQSVGYFEEFIYTASDLACILSEFPYT